MDKSLVIQLLIQCLLTVLGWIVFYLFAIHKNTIIKKKEVTVMFLIEAWRRLEKASNRGDDYHREEVESAIADIHLFGSKRQIELAKRFSDEIAKKKEGSTLELLLLLRDDLRKELNLEKTSENVQFLGFAKDVSGRSV